MKKGEKLGRPAVQDRIELGKEERFSVTNELIHEMDQHLRAIDRQKREIDRCIREIDRHFFARDHRIREMDRRIREIDQLNREIDRPIETIDLRFFEVKSPKIPKTALRRRAATASAKQKTAVPPRHGGQVKVVESSGGPASFR